MHDVSNPNLITLQFLLVMPLNFDQGFRHAISETAILLIFNRRRWQWERRGLC